MITDRESLVETTGIDNWEDISTLPIPFANKIDFRKGLTFKQKFAGGILSTAIALSGCEPPKTPQPEPTPIVTSLSTETPQSALGMFNTRILNGEDNNPQILKTEDNREFVLMLTDFRTANSEFQNLPVIGEVKPDQITNLKLIKEDPEKRDQYNGFTILSKSDQLVPFDPDTKTPQIDPYLRINPQGQIEINIDGTYKPLSGSQAINLKKLVASNLQYLSGIILENSTQVPPTPNHGLPAPTLAVVETPKPKAPESGIDYVKIMQQIDDFKAGTICSDATVMEKGFIPEGTSGSNLGLLEIYEGKDMFGAYIQVCPLAVSLEPRINKDKETYKDLYIIAGYVNNDGRRKVTSLVSPIDQIIASGAKDPFPTGNLVHGQKFDFTGEKNRLFNTQSEIVSFMKSMIGKPIALQLDLKMRPISPSDEQIIKNQGIDLIIWKSYLDFYREHFLANIDLVLDVFRSTEIPNIIGTGGKPADISTNVDLKDIFKGKEGSSAITQILIPGN